MHILLCIVLQIGRVYHQGSIFGHTSYRASMANDSSRHYEHLLGWRVAAGKQLLQVVVHAGDTEIRFFLEWLTDVARRAGLPPCPHGDDQRGGGDEAGESGQRRGR